MLVFVCVHVILLIDKTEEWKERMKRKIAYKYKGVNE